MFENGQTKYWSLRKQPYTFLSDGFQPRSKNLPAEIIINMKRKGWVETTSEGQN